MPLLGFGTWDLRGDEATRATADALRVGYRLIDTATMYGNEREVGAAIREADVPRSEVLVTTKLPPDRGGSERRVLEESLRLLGLERIDLWLIHWPPADNVAMWREFIRAREDDLVRDIGVSNFSLAELDELEAETGVLPAVNQIEWSPLRFDAATVEGHQQRGVVLEGYSGLKGGVLKNSVVTDIANRLGRTPAQVVLRWHLQHGIVAIPKSANPERIASNASIGDFALSDDDVTALDALGG